MTIELNHDAAERALGRDYGRDDRRARPWLIGVVALAVVGTFCGIVWYAYTQGLSQGTRGGSLPVLRADPSPTRERPAEPGGMKVPHQDKLVYDQVARGGSNLSPTVERMLPPPETPIARPVAPPPSVAPPPPAAVTPVTPIQPAPQAAPQSGGSAQPGFAAPQSAPFIRPAQPVAPAPQAAPAPVPPPAIAARPTPAPSTAVPATPAPPTQGTLRPSAPLATATIPPVQPPAPVATAPVAPPPPAAAAPAATPAPAPTAGGSFRIQLAAVRSQEAAQQEWEKMKTAHGPVLGRLSSQIVRVDLGGERGVFFRIQAGPYGDADAARRACTALKERNVSCLVVRP